MQGQIESFSSSSFENLRTTLTFAMSYADYSGNGYEYGHRHSKDRTEGMEDIIQVMNQLYDICHQINADGGASSKLNLPQIVVCGSQVKHILYFALPTSLI